MITAINHANTQMMMTMMTMITVMMTMMMYLQMHAATFHLRDLRRPCPARGNQASQAGKLSLKLMIMVMMLKLMIMMTVMMMRMKIMIMMMIIFIMNSAYSALKIEFHIEV